MRTVGERSGWLKRLFSTDRRRAKRRHLPGLVAHYWDGGSPRARDVVDISPSGSYLQTEERRYPGTVFRVTLQSRASPQHGGAAEMGHALRTLVVLAQIVRAGPDGIGVQFVFPDESDPEMWLRYPECRTDRRSVMRFLQEAEGNNSAVTFSVN